MTERVPLDAPSERFSRKSPLKVRYTERTSYKWAFDNQRVTGNTPAALEEAAMDKVAALTGVPADQLEVAPGYMIYKVAGRNANETTLGTDAIWAKRNANGDTLWASIQVREPLADPRWHGLHARIEEYAMLLDRNGTSDAAAMATAMREVLSWMDEENAS